MKKSTISYEASRKCRRLDSMLEEIEEEEEAKHKKIWRNPEKVFSPTRRG